MSLSRSCTLLAVLAALVVIQGCSSIPSTAVTEDPDWLARYEARSAAITAEPGWAFEGRLAVSDQNDGGSGHLRWREEPGMLRLDFHGAMGRGAWRLQSGPGGAELELATGELYAAATVEELVREQLGWHVPAVSLAWWVRGVQAPGTVGKRVPGPDGTLSELEQDGWRIEYGRYRDVGGILLPLKMTARQQDRAVKLAVREWTIGNDDG